MQNFDLIVLGGGPAGVTAALRARELGATVALVERGTLGGTCTNDGCVPTRALAKAARLLRDTEQHALYGIANGGITLDFQKMMQRTQQVVYEIHEKKQLLQHLRRSGAQVFTESGEAHFVNEKTIALVDGTELSAEAFILCVGGHARRLPFEGAEFALTHSDVWRLRELPERVVIIGAAATGCQLASVFNDFGSKVTLLDAAERILPGEDSAVSTAMNDLFEEDGIDIYTGIERDSKIVRDGTQFVYSVTADGESLEIETDAVLLAVGWPGNEDTLNLEAAGVESDGSYVRVNDYLQTSQPHIYAAGDITGRMMLVQAAQYEARIAAENALLSESRQYEHHVVPHGSFTDPEYASVGLTESAAREQEQIVIATVPYAALDRAVIDGYTRGFCKLIVSAETHCIIGAHVVGEQAVEVVQLVAVAIDSSTPIGELAELELAYPTYTAIVGLAARQIARQLNVTPLAPMWRRIDRYGAAEWERATSESTQ